MSSPSFQSKIDIMGMVVAATATKSDHFCSMVEQVFDTESSEVTALAEEVLDRPGVLDSFDPMEPSQQRLNKMILSMLERCTHRPVAAPGPLGQ